MGTLLLPGYQGKVKYAQFLHDASELRISSPRRDVGGQGDISLSLPVNKPNVEIPVIELILE
jgi:alpha-L-fucosidase